MEPGLSKPLGEFWSKDQGSHCQRVKKWHAPESCCESEALGEVGCMDDHLIHLMYQRGGDSQESFSLKTATDLSLICLILIACCLGLNLVPPPPSLCVQVLTATILECDCSSLLNSL